MNRPHKIKIQRMISSKIALILVASVMTFVAGCDKQSDTKVLKIGHTLVTTHPVHQAMEHLGERLEDISGGKMSVEIYPSGQLGNERELIELLQIGGLAMTKVSASPLEGFIPDMRLFSMPYIFKDADHYWEVLNGDIGRNLLTSGEQFRIRGLVYYDAGSRSFYTSEKRVEMPDDLSGLKIRVQNSQTAVSLVNSMGGSATPISFAELYTALQQGVVDGAENNPPSFYLEKHFEVSKYYTLDEHTSIPDIILISSHIWNGLSEQEQVWLQQAADESVVFQRQLWKEASDKAIREVKKAGVEVIIPDKSKFREKVVHMYEDNTESVKALIQQIQQMAE